ncbi:hypothetical protein Dimus_005617, partial [Dionaea muscipula]
IALDAVSWITVNPAAASGTINLDGCEHCRFKGCALIYSAGSLERRGFRLHAALLRDSDEDDHDARTPHAESQRLHDLPLPATGRGLGSSSGH